MKLGAKRITRRRHLPQQGVISNLRLARSNPAALMEREPLVPIATGNDFRVRPFPGSDALIRSAPLTTHAVRRFPSNIIELARKDDL